MKACNLIEIITPKKIRLYGLWFGPRKPKHVIIWVHGLGSSAFSMQHIVNKLVDTKTAVLTFNNRGHDKVSRLARAVEKRMAKPVMGGAAHEVFRDCVDDIQGAVNFARKAGVKSIYLAGHSTGCQKSIYWAAKKGRAVRGIILLAPVSDWAAEMKLQGKVKLARATLVARALVSRGKKHQLLPPGVWHEPLDAQRFLSLYTPDSVEEIFSYAQPTKVPRLLRSVKIPILVLWAEKDEFASLPALDMTSWFRKHLDPRRSKVVIVPNVGHGFKGREQFTAGTIRRWLSF